MDDRCCGKSRVQKMFLLSVIVMIEIFTSDATELTAVVNTTYGPVQGELLTTVHLTKYAAFKGIPYAEPPIGLQRFKPPVDVKPWNDTFKADKESDGCVRRNFDKGGAIGSENCLFINVFTPVTNLTSTPNVSKPVIVFIHGGGFTDGSSSSEVYRPDYILEKDVVFVSFNYRLGLFGFLNLKHPNATGNAGLKDQVLALKWVKKNILNFGGNPNNVTIFGHDAGAASVGYHVLSEASADLFHGAISMSGTPLNPWAFQRSSNALSQAEKLGTLLHANSTDTETLLKTFYDATPDEIMNAMFDKPKTILFTPTLEDECDDEDVFLSTCSITKYENGEYNQVPQILGFKDQESSLFLTKDGFVGMIAHVVEYTESLSMTLPPALAKVNDIIKSNETSFNYDALTNDTLSAVINETTNIFFVAQIDETQKLIWNYDLPIYYYHFSFTPEKSSKDTEAPDDLSHIFYNPDSNYDEDETDPNMARTTYRFTTMWTNFAKYGDPTPYWIHDKDLNITWPDSWLKGESLEIGTELTPGPRPINEDIRRVQETNIVPLLEVTYGCEKKSVPLFTQIVETYTVIKTFILQTVDSIISWSLSSSTSTIVTTRV